MLRGEKESIKNSYRTNKRTSFPSKNKWINTANIMSGPKFIRWGIASAGLISHDFTNAIVGVLPPEEHKVTATPNNLALRKLLTQVVAVAARKLEDAKAFADKHGIETSYGDYEALAKDSSVDVSIAICL